jgi:hypothetical protein
MTQSIRTPTRRTVFSDRDLAALSELRITPGTSEYRELPNGFWMVTFRKRPDGSVNHLITLALGYPPSDEVCGLAWGLASVDNPESVQHVGRTDRRGQAWIGGLTPHRTYRVRYVPSVRSVEDVAVLERLGDLAAQELLNTAVEDPNLAKPVRERAAVAMGWKSHALSERFSAESEIISFVTRLLQRYRDGERNIPAESIINRPWHLSRGPRLTVPATSRSMTGKSGEGESTPSPLPLMQPLDSIEIDEDAQTLDVLLSREEVPYGVVRLLAWGQEHNSLLGTTILPMPEYRKKGVRYRAASVQIQEVSKGQTDPTGIIYDVQPATDDNLSWFRCDEIEEILRRPAVADNDSLRGDIERLRERLRNQE